MSSTDRETAIQVEIGGQTYTLRGQDPAALKELADYVDAQMQEIAEQTNTVDTARIAILAALNIADELLHSDGSVAPRQLQQTQVARDERLCALLDEVLAA